MFNNEDAQVTTNVAGDTGRIAGLGLQRPLCRSHLAVEFDDGLAAECCSKSGNRLHTIGTNPFCTKNMLRHNERTRWGAS